MAGIRAPFRPRLLLALVSAAFAGHAAASAGRIDFTIGDVSATARDGSARAIAKGVELEPGDTIRTGDDGRVQIRFPDGAYTSVQPNTVFGITEYRYDGKADGSERSFFSLLKGALRTVTGLIGHVNKSAYRITTPTATVGIRGTGGLIQVLQDGSTLIVGTSGIWSLTNQTGSIDVPAGTSGLAPSNPSEPPHETNQVPSLPPAPPLPPPFIAGDQRTANGDPIVGLIPLQSGSGYAVALAYLAYSSGTVTLGSNADAVFDSAGRLTSVTVSSPQLIGGTFSLQGGSNVDFGTDGILAWGRWTGPVNIPLDVSNPVALGPNDGLHYVIGLPTPSLPASGSASYGLLGATSPTYADGHTVPGTFSGSMNVVFGASPSIGLDFTVAMPDGSYAMSTGRQPLTASPGSSLFSGSPSVTSSGPVCSSGCTASVQGFFAGSGAERIGVGYQINDPVAAQDVLGAAAFKKQ